MVGGEVSEMAWWCGAEKGIWGCRQPTQPQGAVACKCRQPTTNMVRRKSADEQREQADCDARPGAGEARRGEARAKAVVVSVIG